MKINVICKNCKIEFLKNECHIININNHFCGRSCSVSYNNKINPKRIKGENYGYISPPKLCIDCGINIKLKSTRCVECLKLSREVNLDTPIEIFFIKNSYAASKYAKIRNHAKKLYLDVFKKCYNCEYDKHVEICHIRAIGTFNAGTPIKVVNDRDNIIGLCPNCHWKFDNGLLKL